MSVKTIRSFRFLFVLAAANLLGACASPPDGQHGQHHPGSQANPAASSPAGASPAQGGTAGATTTQSGPCCEMMGGGGGPGGSGGMGQMDREAMCAMYRGMRDAPSEQERQAMMDRHMQAMSPEMRQRHMEMMRQRCQ